MKIYIVRHAHSYNNLVGIEKRVHEPWITETGKLQAQALGKYLGKRINPNAALVDDDFHNSKGYYFTKFFVSPMHRALQSAELIRPFINTTPEVWVDLHEEGGVWLANSNNIFPGMSRSQIEHEFPAFKISDQVKDDGWWNREKETKEEMYIRANRVAKELLSFSNTNEQLLLLTHSGFIDTLLKVLLKQNNENNLLYITQNTSISRVDIRDDRSYICYINKASHLTAEIDTE